MKHWIIRKPPMYSAMRDANFSPGVVATLVIAFFMFVANYIIREIAASLIDYLSLLHLVQSGVDIDIILTQYAAAPGTMLWALFLNAIMIAIVVFYAGRIERRTLTTIGLSRQRVLPRFASGYVLGALMLTVSVSFLFVTRPFTFTGFMPVAFAFIPAFIVQAASEEVLYRGYLLSSLTAKTSVLTAALLSSALAVLFHISENGTVLYLTEVFLFGVFAALLTIRTGSLWAACGVHAAWNFGWGLVSPVVYKQLATSYAAGAFDLPAAEWGLPGSLYTLPAITLDLILIVLVLFAGSKRLVVRPNEAERMAWRAQRIARLKLKGCRDELGKPLIRYALAAAQAMRSERLQAASLLTDALENGFPPESLADFSEDVCRIARTLVRRDETDSEYSTRVKADPDTFAVWKTRRAVREKRLIEYLRWDRRRSKSAPALPDAIHCPMLRSDIRLRDCADIAAQVDSYAEDEEHAPLRRLDRSLCRACVRHTP
ncbi:MAG: type II CAAX endopeptidase family protein, partial [Bacillota bacterium]